MSVSPLSYQSDVARMNSVGAVKTFHYLSGGWDKPRRMKDSMHSIWHHGEKATA